MPQSGRQLAGTLLAVTALGAQALETPVEPAEAITWLVGDSGLASSPSQKRPSDFLLDWLAEHLPELKHARVAANAQRGWQMIVAGEPVCTTNLVRTPEREKAAYFSNTSLYATPQVYLRREALAGVPRDAHGEVDLPRLLADSRLKGAIVRGRSYGVTIDAWLRARPAAATLQEVAAADFGSNLLPMLSRGRMDYVIEYPAAVLSLAPQYPAVRELTGLAIARTEKLLTVGVACPRTPWGLAAIRRIDRVLATPAGVEMLRENLDRQWPRESRHAFAAQIEAFFNRRARPSDF
jgi:uncharacterized protein (TIGR02285 family)